MQPASPTRPLSPRQLLLTALLCSTVCPGVRAQAPSVADLTTLPAVNVEGQSEAASGPVLGYVAKRSEAGTKTDTKLIETPQSISVVPQDQITQQGAQTLNEALHYTAGVATETRGGVATRYDQMTIRGFTPDYYLDGLKLLGNNW